jgi:kinesin family member C2/C3
MVGDDNNPGLYFSAVDEIYKIIKRTSHRLEYDISVSVIEIYNEQIRDLLAKD